MAELLSSSINGRVLCALSVTSWYVWKTLRGKRCSRLSKETFKLRNHYNLVFLHSTRNTEVQSTKALLDICPPDTLHFYCQKLLECFYTSRPQCGSGLPSSFCHNGLMCLSCGPPDTRGLSSLTPALAFRKNSVMDHWLIGELCYPTQN